MTTPLLRPNEADARQWIDRKPSRIAEQKAIGRNIPYEVADKGTIYEVHSSALHLQVKLVEGNLEGNHYKL